MAWKKQEQPIVHVTIIEPNLEWKHTDGQYRRYPEAPCINTAKMQEVIAAINAFYELKEKSNEKPITATEVATMSEIISRAANNVCEKVVTIIEEQPMTGCLRHRLELHALYSEFAITKHSARRVYIDATKRVHFTS